MAPRVVKFAEEINRRGLQKKLAEDIERNGGIQSFISTDPDRPRLKQARLYHIMQADTATYGMRGDKIRNRLGQIVTEWKGWQKKGEYVERVLNRFNVKPWALRTEAERHSVVPTGEWRAPRQGDIVRANSAVAAPAAATTIQPAATAATNWATTEPEPIIHKKTPEEKSAVVQSTLNGLRNVDSMKRSLEGQADYSSSAVKKRKMKALKKAERLLIKTIEALSDSEDEDADADTNGV